MHRVALSILLSLLLVACASGPRVRYDRAPDFDPGAAATFGFFAPLGTDRNGYDTLISQRLKAAARSGLEGKGYRYSEENPDLLVNFSARLDERVRTSPEPSMGVGYYNYRRGFYSGWLGYDSQRIETYREGTLNIDVVDPETMRMVWEGVAVGRVSGDEMDPDSPAIENAVADILRGFPPSSR
ncbi:MAG: DUF4136 domain-containing protein [Pseudomonadales bacterium]|jgi:hypothetical protein|nr:DUF4136 domain-containing protein [Pseudomonadales bacterium]